MSALFLSGSPLILTRLVLSGADERRKAHAYQPTSEDECRTTDRTMIFRADERRTIDRLAFGPRAEARTIDRLMLGGADHPRNLSFWQ